METRELTICSCCGKVCETDGNGTGYGEDEHGNKYCYKCCGDRDKQALADAKIGDKFIFYLTFDQRGNGTVSNWPGTYQKSVWVRIGKHNIARRRYDCWFKEGVNNFHGVRFGDNTEVCHVKCIK